MKQVIAIFLAGYEFVMRFLNPPPQAENSQALAIFLTVYAFVKPFLNVHTAAVVSVFLCGVFVSKFKEEYQKYSWMFELIDYGINIGNHLGCKAEEEEKKEEAELKKLNKEQRPTRVSFRC